jgi:hypothetical protein
MTNIALINDEGISTADMTTLVTALQAFCDQVTKAWNQPSVKVSTEATPGSWVVHLTEAKRSLGALGYHTVEAGLPVAYVSLKAVNGKLWGKYYKPMVIKGKLIRDAVYSAGLISVICHEVAEMLCDPAIQTVSAKDAQGRQWLVEVCDHCYGSYTTQVINGNLCILPDVTTPAFYDLNGKAPFTIFNAIKAPFTMTPKGYGYYKSATGALVKL